MSSPKELPLQKLQFYVTTPYPCGYIAKNLAQSLIASPHHVVDADVYSELIKQGFRRSGKFAYRPHCEHCHQCVPVRVVLNKFLPTRSQKRAYKRHSNLTATVLPLDFYEAHFTLYRQYQSSRHPAESEQSKNACNEEKEQYKQFLCQSNVESLMIEFKDAENQIKIVSVVDIIEDGVSAVYTFYDTEQKASYGTYAIIWLAEWTKNLRLPYLYLGYWIAESQKMAYKKNFQGQEKLINGDWINDDPADEQTSV